jgi:hypothetical protein
MDDDDSMKNHINSFNTLVIQRVFIEVNMEEEDKWFTLLCSLTNSWDNLVVVIDNSTQSTLKFEDVVASFLL